MLFEKQYTELIIKEWFLVKDQLSDDASTYIWHKLIQWRFVLHGAASHETLCC